MPKIKRIISLATMLTISLSGCALDKSENALPWTIGFSILLLIILAVQTVMHIRQRHESQRLAELLDKRTRELGECNNELREYATELDGRARELEECNKELDHQKLLSVRASEAKGNFLANMSHEIRTPMNAIIGMTTLGKSANDISRKDYCLSKIDEAAKHLLGIISDILDMSKIEAGKLELSSGGFVFEDMVHRVVNGMGFRVDERKQRLFVYIDRNIPYMLTGDSQRLAQVITNLLSNAVKFTPERGDISITAKLVLDDASSQALAGIPGRQSASTGDCAIEICVKDTGIGITEEQRSRLFSAFEQAENSNTRKFGGTGLGLAISQKIVELMGGDIRVDSEPQKGAAFTFTVHMPVCTEEEDPLTQMDPEQNLRLLVVDDDRASREYFEELAMHMGISCHIADSGAEALANIKRFGHYSIYFIDWKMPVMDGIELMSHILELQPDSCAVLMASNAECSIIAEKAKKAGITQFLTKPLFLSAIADCVNAAVQAMQKASEKADATVVETVSDTTSVESVSRTTPVESVSKSDRQEAKSAESTLAPVSRPSWAQAESDADDDWKTPAAKKPASPSPTKAESDTDDDWKTPAAKKPASPSPAQAEQDADDDWKTPAAKKPASPSPAQAEQDADDDWKTPAAKKPAPPSPAKAESATGAGWKPSERKIPTPSWSTETDADDDWKTSVVKSPASPSPVQTEPTASAEQQPLAAPAAASANDNPVQAAPPAKISDGDLSKYHILLVDDVELNREIVISILEDTHIGIDTAENGEEAVQMFKDSADKYSMILMDLQMPKMDGYEATKAIRASDAPHAKDIPICAVTANVFREDVEKCLASGMNDHIGKPVDFNQLMGKLDKYLAS